jgi:hypothetical protein
MSLSAENLLKSQVFHKGSKQSEITGNAIRAVGRMGPASRLLSFNENETVEKVQ